MTTPETFTRLKEYGREYGKPVSTACTLHEIGHLPIGDNAQLFGLLMAWPDLSDDDKATAAALVETELRRLGIRGI